MEVCDLSGSLATKIDIGNRLYPQCAGNHYFYTSCEISIPVVNLRLSEPDMYAILMNVEQYDA